MNDILDVESVSVWPIERQDYESWNLEPEIILSLQEGIEKVVDRHTRKLLTLDMDNNSIIIE